jgi:hypothetical protein
MSLTKDAQDLYTADYEERIRYYKQSGFSTIEAVEQVDIDYAQEAEDEMCATHCEDM